MGFELDPSYKQVPERIADLKERYPDASLQPVNPERPFWFETAEGRTFVCYSAACYRTPDDPRPGIGTAWEPFPGTTPYTKNSEVQNAETSAWGRAIVAALASESKSIASAEDVRNRKAEPVENPYVSAENAQALRDKCELLGLEVSEVVKLGTEGRTSDPAQVRKDEIRGVKDAMDSLTPQAGGGDEGTNGRAPGVAASSPAEVPS